MVRPRVARERPVDEHEVPRQPEDTTVPRVVHRDDRDLHPFLQFTNELDRTDRDILRDRARRRKYAPMRYLSWDILQRLEFISRAEELCGSHWKALFTISESVSDILSIEFFSTFHMLTPLTDYETDAALTFRLGGREWRLSLRQFAVHMGLFTQDELDTPVFTEGLRDWPQGVTAAHAWAELGTGELETTPPKSTLLRDPLMRIFHRAIAHGITGRGDSAVGNVMHSDLFYLYCLVHRRPCQIAERLARYLFHVRRQKHTQAIFGGGYVLRLAKSLGVAIPSPPGVPRLVAPPRPIDMTVLCHMGLVEKVDGSFVVVQEPTIAPQVGPRAHDHEAGSSGTAGADVEMTDPPASGRGGVQEQTVPETTQIPVPPRMPFVERTPARPIRHVFERDRLGSNHRLQDILRIEIARQEQARAIMLSALRTLAASATPPFAVPDLPPPPQVYADFIRDVDTTPAPDSDQQHTPPQP